MQVFGFESNSQRGAHDQRTANRFEVSRIQNDSESANQDYPVSFLLYVIAYLDRINIGFAALTMNKELAITSQQFWIPRRDLLFRLLALWSS